MEEVNKRSFFEQKAFWSFLFLFAAWTFYFWPILKTIFNGAQEVSTIFSTWAISFSAILLIFLRRKTLKKTLVASSQLGLLFLLIVSFGYIAAGVFNIEYVQQSAVMLMIPGLVITVFGPMVSRVILFPLLYLMLIIPLQDNTFNNRSAIVFVAAFLFVFYLRYLYKHGKKEPDSSNPEEKPIWYYQNSRWFIPTAIAYSLLMVSPWLTENIRHFYPQSVREFVLRAPLGTQGWMGPSIVKNKAWEPLYTNASAAIQARYISPNIADQDSIYLYTAYYHSDRSVSDMLYADNVPYDTDLWKRISSRTVDIDLSQDRKMTVLEVVLQAGGVSRVAWYWYYIAGVATIDPSLAGVLDKVRIVSKYAQGSGFILISSSFVQSPDEARNRLAAFMLVMSDALDVLKQPEINYKQDNQRGK